MKRWRFINDRKSRNIRKRLTGATDFSVIEDRKDAFSIIQEIASRASQSAVAEAKAMGLSRTFARDNQIIRLHANGHEEVVNSKLPSPRDLFVHKLATVFHARKR